MQKPSLTRELADALRAARRGIDARAVHRARTACRRLRIALALRGLTVLQPDLHWLGAQLAPARDLDVALKRELPAAARAWLRRRRVRAQRELRAALDSARVRGLLVALPLALEKQRARAEAMRAPLAQLRKRARAAARHEATIAELHALRKSVRRMHHGLHELDMTGHPHKAKRRELLDALGAACDAHVFNALLAGSGAGKPPPRVLGPLRSAARAELRARIQTVREAVRAARRSLVTARVVGSAR